MRKKIFTHARENLIWKYASILPKQVDNWITSLLDFPTWQLTMTVMLRWIYTDMGIKGKGLVRFCGWLECVMFGLLLLTCKKVAWNDWMKQVGENEAYFQFKFSRACVNHLLRMKCHMKAKTMDIKAMILICFKRLLKKLKKLTQSCNLLVQMKIW